MLWSFECSVHVPVVVVICCKLCLTFCHLMDLACQAPLSSTISWSLLKSMPIVTVMLSNHLFFCCPLLFSPSIFPSIRVFSNELTFHIRCSKCWSFSSGTVLPMNIQSWFPYGLTSLISLLSKGISRVCSNTTIWKGQLFGAQPSLWPNSLTSIHDYLKNHSFDPMDIWWQCDASAF